MIAGECWYIGKIEGGTVRYVTEDNTLTGDHQWGVEYPSKKQAVERLKRGVYYDGMLMPNLSVLRYLATITEVR